MNNSKKIILTALIAIALISTFTFFYPSKEKNIEKITYPEVTHVKEDDFEALLKKHEIVVLFIHMDKCPPCERLAPTINQLATECEKETVFIGKINRKNAMDLTEKHGVKMFPTILVFKNSILVKQFQGCSTSKVTFFSNVIEALSDK